MNASQPWALSWGTALCAGPREIPMNMSEMTHRVTDALKRMTDRLTHRRDTHPKQPSNGEQQRSMMPDKRSDTD
jgi:energy-coupling factor transporter ATP-binding protein EcfA2